MKPFPAIATLEFREIAAGMIATDAMVKKSPIALLRSGTISAGRWLTLVGGSTAAVEEAHAEGLRVGAESVADHVFLPDVDEQLFAALDGARQPTQGDALGILETATVSCNFRATEVALKTAPLTLLELRFGDAVLAGKAVSLLHGVLHDVQAGMGAAVDRLSAAGVPVSHRIITAPHFAVFLGVNQTTGFHEGRGLALEGEAG